MPAPAEPSDKFGRHQACLKIPANNNLPPKNCPLAPLDSTYNLFPEATLETLSENKPLDHACADGHCCLPRTLSPSGDFWLISAFTTHRAAGAGAGLLTCTVRRGQHDGGDPRDLAIGRAKEILDFFEEDG